MSAFTNFTYLLPTTTNFSYFFPIIPLQQNLDGYTYLQSNSSAQVISKCIPHQNIPPADSEEEILPDFRCKLCSLTISNFSEFQQHMTSHEIGESTSAEDKDNKLSALIDLSLQTSLKSLDEISAIEKSTDTDEMSLPCSYCSQTFKDPYSAIKHMRMHPSGNKIVCVVCKKTFFDVSGLRKHILMNHCEKGRRHCPYCSYKCYQSSDLEKHIARRHTRDFKYKCSCCIKGFATPKELANHLRRVHFRPKIVKGTKRRNMSNLLL